MPKIQPSAHSHSKQSHVGSPSGGVTQDVQARAAIDELRVLLINLGLMES